MKNILVVAAHPDDEALGLGGTIAKLASQGNEISVIWLTNGVGARDSNQADITEREAASKKAVQILGVKKTFQLDLPDNALDSIPLLKVIKAIEEIYFKINPNIVFTHHGNDLNIDHRIAYQATLTVARPLPNSKLEKILTFETLSSTNWQPITIPSFLPNVHVDISDFYQQKADSLLAYEREMRSYPHSRSFEGVKALAQYRGSNIGRNLVESFQLERSIEI